MTSIRMAPKVPTFSLYGEREGSLDGDWLHCESIASRSGLHDWEIRLHRHDRFFQILYVAAGGGECALNGRSAPLAPPCAVTVAPGEVHGFRFSEDVQGWVFTIFAERALEAMGSPELRQAFARSMLMEFRDSPAAAAIEGCLGLVSEEVAGLRPGRGRLIEQQLSSAFVLMARQGAGPLPGRAPGAPLERQAMRFRELLDRRFRAERSIGFYAQALGISETHLNRVCRTMLGCSALEAVHRRILAEARRDLTFTNMSVADIALSLGFEDPAYFSRFFAKAAGLSPRRFRQQAQGGPCLSATPETANLP